MTLKAFHKLLNEHPHVDFCDLGIYGLIREGPYEFLRWSGQLLAEFDYPRLPRKNNDRYFTVSYLGYVEYRDYLASHRLNRDGTLTLIGYEYVHLESAIVDGKDSVSIQIEQDLVNEPVSGDFEMILQPYFDSDLLTFVPFRDGHIIEDRSRWFVSP